MKIRFVFHKPKGEFRWWPPRYVGTGIVIWTWVLATFYSWRAWLYNYSHVEIWLPAEGSLYGKWQHNREGITCLVGNCPLDGLYQGRCFSSTTRGGAKGVRFAPAGEVLGKHPDRWDYIEVEVDPERLEVAVQEAEKLVGAKYDYAYLVNFLQPFIIQKESDWACSEICDWFRALCRIPTNGKKRLPSQRYRRISPRRKAFLLAKVWGEPKALI